MDTNKSSLNNELPHLGEEINKMLVARGINQSSLARKMGKGSTAINFMLNKKSIQVKVLWELCKVLNYDFFDYLSGCLYRKSDGKIITKQEQIDTLQQQIADLQKEIAIYKDILKSR